MNELKIDTDIPIPERQRKYGVVTNALRKLKVGDSFVLPSSFKQACVSGTAKRVGVKVTTSKVEEGGEKKLRVWRIE